MSLREVQGSFTSNSGSDMWVWRAVLDGVFLVASTYTLVAQRFGGGLLLQGDLVDFLGDQWESLAPSRVQAFCMEIIFLEASYERESKT